MLKDRGQKNWRFNTEQMMCCPARTIQHHRIICVRGNVSGEGIVGVTPSQKPGQRVCFEKWADEIAVSADINN